MLRPSAPALLLCSAGVLVSSPPTTQDQRQPFRSRSDLVRLDVSVMNKDGRPVRGLVADDFTIRDNDREYSPSVFEEIEIPPVFGTDSMWPSVVRPDVATNSIADNARLLVIVLDDSALSGTSARSIQQSRTIARSVVEEMAPSDLAAVVFTGDSRGAQNFTNDKDKLRRAIDRLHAGFVAQAGIPLPGGGSIDLGYTEEHLMRGSIRTLHFVSETLRQAPGRRKALIYVSSGVPVRFSDPDDDKADDAREVFEQAQLANVAVYSFNPTGLEFFPSGTRRERSRLLRSALARDYLEVVAANTGGFAVVETNNPAESVRRVFQENSSYYLMGYVPADPPPPGRRRSIDVRVNRPDLTVRARDGYFTPRLAAAVSELSPRDRALREALTSLLPDGDLPMRMQVAAIPIPGSQATALAVIAEVQPPVEARSQRDRLVEFVTTAFDSRGRSRAAKSQQLRLGPRPGVEDGRYELRTRLDVEAGRYEVRLAGYDAGRNLSGSVFQDLDVPDFSKNGVMLSDILIAADGAPSGGPDDTLADLVPMVPTTRREFRTSDVVTAFIRVHQGGQRPPVDSAVVVRILAGDDGTVYEETLSLPASRFALRRSADALIDLPMSALAAGPHLLEIGIAGRDQAGTHRRLRFEVK